MHGFITLSDATSYDKIEVNILPQTPNGKRNTNNLDGIKSNSSTSGKPRRQHFPTDCHQFIIQKRRFRSRIQIESGRPMTIRIKYNKESMPWNCWLCWGLTSQSTIFQSCRDGAIASWVINQYFRGVKCLAQGHNTAAVGLEPRTSRSGVRHSTTEPPRSPPWNCVL